MPPGIEDRDADVWEPLLAIADAIGGDWPERARVAAVALVGAARDAEPSLGIRLLIDIRTIFDQTGADALPTTVILKTLVELPESPWGDLKGKAITDRSLAKRLQQYGIKPKVVRVGESTPRGYSKADFHDAWSRYCPRIDAVETQHAQQAQHTAENGHSSQENVADTEDCECNNVSSKRNTVEAAENVADGERNGSDESNRICSIKSNDVADVADVALARRDERAAATHDDGLDNGLLRQPPDAICAQCHLGDGVLKPERANGRLVWLHLECRQFWEKERGDFKHSFAGFPSRKPADLNGGTGHRCDHCGLPGASGQWDWQGRPDRIWLHPRCEAPWFDSEGRQ